MMNDDYFCLTRARDNRHALLDWDMPSRPFDEQRDQPADLVARFTIAKPAPAKPVWADLHSVSGDLVISARVRDVLARFPMHGCQLLPATIRTASGQHQAWLLHAWRRIPAINRERSDAVWEEPDNNVVMEVNTLVLDDDALGRIPLPQRRVFRLRECMPYIWVHRDLKEALEQIPDLTGVKWTPAGAWRF